jgi:hypothetical protein
MRNRQTGGYVERIKCIKTPTNIIDDDVPKNQTDSELSPVSAALLEWAEYWYPISWKGLLVSGGLTALAAIATIVFLLLQWLATNIREQHSEWRTSVLELKTTEAKAELAKAKENTAKIELVLNDEVKKNAWRRLSKEQHDEIAAAIRREPPVRLTVAFDGNDPEASVFAADLIRSFEDGGAFVNLKPSAVFIGQMPVFGLLLQASPDFDAAKVESAVSSAAPLGKSESLTSFPAQSRADIFLYVGHKPQAF